MLVNTPRHSVLSQFSLALNNAQLHIRALNVEWSGVVQWLRVENHDREIRVQFPAPADVSDLVVACHSS